ncbi:MAG TPA: tRNA lysidine(34) synthetase TilS [Candidatus Dependentiae bacterium]|nr:tRNA lysidine(34) synthetase TilS [Candidatus Dependentiae bacterium]HRQ62650.1 tRNA lysidine(34) synthetase TilS [Candidatus Dependentiae bacterium]
MNNSLLTSIHTFIQQHNLLPSGSRVVLGLSGGPDSIFLLYILADLHKQGIIQLTAAHLDHEWRADSSKDVKFCQMVTHKLGIPFVSKKISELSSAKWDGSKEEFGRVMRRQFLESVAQEIQADRIALAHHLQDQEETFFIRLIRGSSLTGLTAMRAQHGNYIRPLLEVNKQDIIAYLAEHDISYLIDPSNESPLFLRNRIRNTVMPALRACDTRFDQNFLITLNRLKDTEHFLEQLTAETFAHITKTDNNTTRLHIPQLLALHPVLVYRILVYWFVQSRVPFDPSQKFFDEILRFLRQPGSKTHAIHQQWSLVKEKEWGMIK